MPKASKHGVPGLYRTEKGWHIDLRWRDPKTGKAQRYRERISRTLPAATAKERARTLLASAKAGTFDAHRKPLPALRAAFEEYGKTLDANFPKYAKKRRAALKRLLAGIGDKVIDQVSPLDVERLKRERLTASGGKPRKPATVNRDLEILKTFFRWAIGAFGLPEHNARLIRGVKKLREKNERVRSLTTEEESRLLAALKVHAARVTRVALLTGMRQSELLGLRKGAVDAEHAMVTLTDTKNGEPRPVFLNEEALAVIQQAMAASPCEHVFVSRVKMPYTADGFRSVFRRACVRAGITDFRFHDTRHTTATRLRRANVGLDVVAKALGHKSLRMTTRYAHIEPATMRAAMTQLPALATPSRETTRMNSAPV